jgi:hypothetical protein
MDLLGSQLSIVSSSGSLPVFGGVFGGQIGAAVAGMGLRVVVAS